MGLSAAVVFKTKGSVRHLACGMAVGSQVFAVGAEFHLCIPKQVSSGKRWAEAAMRLKRAGDVLYQGLKTKKLTFRSRLVWLHSLGICQLCSMGSAAFGSTCQQSVAPSTSGCTRKTSEDIQASFRCCPAQEIVCTQSRTRCCANMAQRTDDRRE